MESGMHPIELAVLLSHTFRRKSQEPKIQSGCQDCYYC